MELYRLAFPQLIIPFVEVFESTDIPEVAFGTPVLARKVRYGSLLAVTLNWESPRAVKVRSEVVDKVWSIFGSTFHSGVRYRAFSTGEVLVSNW